MSKDEYLPARTTSVDELIQRLKTHFAMWVEACRFAKTTVDTYRQAVRRFTEWVEQAGQQPMGDMGISFRNHLLDSGRAPRTVNLTLGAMRTYFRFLIARGVLPPLNPFVGPKAKVARRGRMATLTIEECSKLLRSIPKKRPIDLRDRAIIRLMLSTGLRVSGVVAADIEDLAKLEKKRILYVKHKGRLSKDDFVALGPGIDSAIKAYLRCLKRTFQVESGPLFRSHPGPKGEKLGGRLTRQTLYDAIVTRSRNAKVTKITPHGLRRTAITIGRKRGATLEDLKDMAGHASVKTTEGYDHHQRRLAQAPEFMLDKLLGDV